MPKRRIIYILSLICLFINLNLKSKNIVFDHIPLDSSFGGILNIIEDSKGFLWLGTINGLYRFDGERFRHFKSIAGDINSISDNAISSLYEDETGILWICTTQGLNAYDPETEKFTCFYPKKEDLSSGSNFITVIKKKDKDSLWIGTNQGLYVFDKKTKEFNQKDNKIFKKLSNLFTTSIIRNTDRELLVGTTSGLFHLNFIKTDFIHYLTDKNKQNSLPDIDIGAIFKDKKGDIYLGTAKGLCSFNIDNGTFYSLDSMFNNQNVKISTITEDKDGALWIGTYGNGLYIWGKDRQNINHYKYNTNPDSIRARTIYSIHESRSGIMWLSGDIKWLIRSNNYNVGFERYFIKKNKRKSENSVLIASLYKDRSGDLLVGTLYNGLYLYKNKKFFKFDMKFIPDKIFENMTIKSILRDSKNILWIGTGEGIFKIDIDKEIFFNIKNDKNEPDSLINNDIHSIFEDRKGDLWIGTTGGLDKYDRTNNKFIHYINDPLNNESLSNNIILTLFEDSEEDLWIGTMGGMNKLIRADNTFVRFQYNKMDLKSISNNKVNSIFEDRNGTLWIGTIGGGINKFNKKKSSFERYQTKDGLSSNLIFGITDDQSGNLCIMSSLGLSIFDPDSKNFDNFNIGGLITDAAHYKKKGEFYIGGRGLYKFSKTSFKFNKKESVIALTGFKIFNESVEIKNDGDTPLSKSITDTRKIVLNYKQNVFSFEFAILDYSDPKDRNYTYMMEGFTEKWINLGVKSDITFTNLDPGDYIFRVKGKSSNGIWNKDGIAVSIIITPPFWMTLWFKILSIFIIILLLIVLYRVRIKKIEKKIKNEYTLDQFYSKYNISEREKEILELLIKGKTNREIEDILYISYHTVRNHVRNIYKKLDIKNKSDLILALGPINSNTVKEKKI